MGVRRTFVFPLLLIFAALVLPPGSAAQEVDFGKLPSHLVEALAKSQKSFPGHPTLYVANFAGGGSLGQELASELADTLRKDLPGYTMLSESDVAQPLAKLNLKVAILSTAAVACYHPDLEVSVIIRGSFKRELHDAELSIEAWAPKNDRILFRGTKTIELTPQIREMFAHPSPTSYFIDEAKSDFGENPPALVDTVPSRRAYETAINLPTCLYCPAPDSSIAPKDGKIQGQVLLRVRIEADGSVGSVVVLRGLPCGLTYETIRAVRNWKFGPATTADGTPVPVEIPVEVTFNLY